MKFIPETPSKRTFLVALFLVLLLCWMTFEKLIGVRFTNPDDMFYSIPSVGSYFANANGWAMGTGRFPFYYTWVFSMITPAFWDTPILDVAMYGSLAAVLVGILGLAQYLGQVRLGLLFAIVYLAFIPVTFTFNPVVSYPFAFTAGILLWLASLFLLETYLRRRKDSLLYLACVLTFLAYGFHETLFAAFTVANLTFIVIRQDHGTLMSRLSNRASVAVLGTSVAYATIFVAFYIAHPTGYAGNKIKLGEAGFVADYFNAVAYFISASLPLFHFVHGYPEYFSQGGGGIAASLSLGRGGPSVLENIEASQIVRSLLIGGAFLVAVSRVPARINASTLRGVLVIGLALLILPAAIVSLSRAYQVYVRGGYAPLHVTFFGYFGATLLICALIVSLLIFTRTTWRQVLALGIAIVLCYTALLADVFNDQVVDIMHVNSARWTVASTLMRYFAVRHSNVPIPALIISPQLWDFEGNPGLLPDTYWQRLFKAKVGIDVAFAPQATAHIPKQSANLYYDCPKPTNCVLLLELNQSRTTEVITTSPLPRFLTYPVKDTEKTVAVVPVLQRAPTLLHRGIYEATLPLDPVEWRVQM